MVTLSMKKSQGSFSCAFTSIHAVIVSLWSDLGLAMTLFAHGTNGYLPFLDSPSSLPPSSTSSRRRLISIRRSCNNGIKVRRIRGWKGQGAC